MIRIYRLVLFRNLIGLKFCSPTMQHLTVVLLVDYCGRVRLLLHNFDSDNLIREVSFSDYAVLNSCFVA